MSTCNSSFSSQKFWKLKQINDFNVSVSSNFSESLNHTIPYSPENIILSELGLAVPEMVLQPVWSHHSPVKNNARVVTKPGLYSWHRGSLIRNRTDAVKVWIINRMPSRTIWVRGFLQHPLHWSCLQRKKSWRSSRSIWEALSKISPIEVYYYRRRQLPFAPEAWYKSFSESGSVHVFGRLST